MPEQIGMHADDAELDRHWTHPDAVLRRYGVGGEVYQARSIYEFRQPPLSEDDALDKLRWTGAEAVLDAGCGRGAYLTYIARRLATGGSVVALDFSPAMARMARARAPSASLVVGDVQALPVADTSFDVVLSAHMLYHVPDIRGAVAEFRRVLKPDCRLVIIVGSARDQAELDTLFMTAGGAFPLARYSDRFTADNAPEYLDGIFSRVERLTVQPQLVITEAEALVSYFDSMRSLAEASLQPAMTWEAFTSSVRRIAGETLASEGAFHVSEEIVMLICR